MACFATLAALITATGPRSAAAQQLAFAPVAEGRAAPATVAPAVPASSRAPELRGIHRARQKELVWEIGPVHLAANIAYGDVAPSVALAATLPVSGWLCGAETEIVGSDGRPITQQLLHHMVIYAPGKRDLSSPIMLRVAAFGAERSDIRLPGRLGYRFEAGDSLLVKAVFFNPTGAEQEAYLRVRLPYRTDRFLLPPHLHRAHRARRRS